MNDRISEHELIAEDVYNALKLSRDPAKLVLDALDGFFPPHWKKGNLEYDGDVARKSCVLLLEQLLKMKPGIKKTVREEARVLAGEWREKMWMAGESYLLVLGFLLFLVVFRVSSNFEKDELRRLCGMVHEHRVAGQLRCRLGLLQKRNVSSMAPQVKEKQPDTMPVMDAVTSSSMDSSIELHSVLKSMDANCLRSYLSESVKDQNSFHEKALNCLRCSSDPAKLVLDVVPEFYLQLDDIQGDTNKECCNFLLELLMKLSPDITPLVKEAAVNLAAAWKARLAREGNKPFNVFCFLKFLAAYGLASSFEADELLSLFSTFYSTNGVYELEQNPSLCRALGLEIKIPDLIQSLTENNQRLEVVWIICAFNLVTKFPPVPLLKAHLNYIKTTALKTCKNFKNTVKAQNKCANRQILSLQGVIKCILDFKLESKYLPTTIQQRIKQLEEEKIKRNSINQGKKVLNKKSGTQLESKGGMKRAISPTATMPNQLPQKRPENCPNQGEIQNSASSTVSVATLSNIESLNPASQGLGQQFTVNATPTWQFGQLPTVNGQFQQCSVHGSGLTPKFSYGEFGAVGASSCSISPTVNPTGLAYNSSSSLPPMPASVGNGWPPSSGRYGLQYLYPPTT